MLARKTSGEGVALIRKFEGCEFQAYQCSASVWTLGYGHTRDVSEGDTCTKDEAEQTLISDLGRWNKAGGKVLDGLVRRREAEALLWLGDEWSHV